MRLVPGRQHREKKPKPDGSDVPHVAHQITKGLCHRGLSLSLVIFGISLFYGIEGLLQLCLDCLRDYLKFRIFNRLHGNRRPYNG